MDILNKYTKFIFNLTNSAVDTLNLQMICAPWIQLGFNIWVDPLDLDKVYYVQSITHIGNQMSGATTSLGLTMGRERIDFVDGNGFGALSSIPDNIFVSRYKKDVASFGSYLSKKDEYDSTINEWANFHLLNEEAIVKASENSVMKSYYGTPLTEDFLYTPRKESPERNNTGNKAGNLQDNSKNIGTGIINLEYLNTNKSGGTQHKFYPDAPFVSKEFYYLYFLRTPPVSVKGVQPNVIDRDKPGDLKVYTSGSTTVNILGIYKDYIQTQYGWIHFAYISSTQMQKATSSDDQFFYRAELINPKNSGQLTSYLFINGLSHDEIQTKLSSMYQSAPEVVKIRANRTRSALDNVLFAKNTDLYTQKERGVWQ